MPLYEHIFIARQDLSNAQAETMMQEAGEILGALGGRIVESEYWGLRAMAYKINKNRKGHYGFLRLDAPAEAVHELERRQRFNEDVLRSMSLRVEKHEEGPSAVMSAKSNRDERRGRGGRDRDRDRDRDRGERGPREDRDGERGGRHDRDGDDAE